MPLRRWLHRLEALKALDPVAGRLSSLVAAATSPKKAKNLLTGKWLGHPLHPVLTDLPIGAWVAAALLDAAGGERARSSADALVAFGVAAAVPTVATGATDWADYNDDRVRRVGLVHALANSMALACYVASLMQRRGGSRARAKTLSYVGLGAMTVGGYLGGHMSYGLASGVDRTTFDDGPNDWVDVMDEHELSEGLPHPADAAGTAIVLVRSNGAIQALAATCSHMGGPLADGELDDGCIRCPWHGSVFRLEDGSVVRGPATAPQPVFQTRVRYGRVSVRAVHRPRA